MGASEPKWVSPNAIQYGVNSLRLGSLHIQDRVNFYSKKIRNILMNWRPTNQSDLSPIKYNMELTHLGSEASNFTFKGTINVPYFFFNFKNT